MNSKITRLSNLDGLDQVQSPLVLFLSEDFMLESSLLENHVTWHVHHPDAVIIGGSLGSTLKPSSLNEAMADLLAFELHDAHLEGARVNHLLASHMSCKTQALKDHLNRHPGLDLSLLPAHIAHQNKPVLFIEALSAQPASRRSFWACAREAYRRGQVYRQRVRSNVRYYQAPRRQKRRKLQTRLLFQALQIAFLSGESHLVSHPTFFTMIVKPWLLQLRSKLVTLINWAEITCILRYVLQHDRLAPLEIDVKNRKRYDTIRLR